MDHEKSTQKIVGYSDAPFVMQLRFELRSLIGLEEPYDHEEDSYKEIHGEEIYSKEVYSKEVCREEDRRKGKEGSREKNRSEENSGEEEEFRSKVQSFGRQKC
jgi:hypothetical protein